ncbi:hypothetical protein LX32DRAFT_715619 [Colletotrichum zoysiae]|uniref:Uncharacterized protein n=1 Tax=Colletotrichum zoysiae TaxID=1216348 RepID=A0AAD9LTK2_9PEZI|nr:hypothetical protein LX32DRAFT_715619 [Colletotrichum zoysiae]
MQGSYFFKYPPAVDFDEVANGFSYNPLSRSWWSSAKSPRWLAVGSLFVFSLMISLEYISIQHYDHSTFSSITTCGSTPDEARMRGCRFESHNFAWTPKECYDEELNQQWDSKPWGYSRDPKGIDLISPSEVLKGDLEWAYVTLNQHMSHCVLIWQKYQRAVMFNRPADNWTTSFAHTQHCGHMLVQWDLNHSEYNSILYTKYVSCGYDWKNPDHQIQELMTGPMHMHNGLTGDSGTYADTYGAKTIEGGHESEHHI